MRNSGIPHLAVFSIKVHNVFSSSGGNNVGAPNFGVSDRGFPCTRSVKVFLGMLYFLAIDLADSPLLTSAIAAVIACSVHLCIRGLRVTGALVKLSNERNIACCLR